MKGVGLGNGRKFTEEDAFFDFLTGVSRRMKIEDAKKEKPFGAGLCISKASIVDGFKKRIISEAEDG